MREHERAPFAEFTQRVQGKFVIPHLLHDGGPCSLERIQDLLAGWGGHWALDGPEGAVWRVERQGGFPGQVCPAGQAGRTVPAGLVGQPEVWNWRAKIVGREEVEQGD